MYGHTYSITMGQPSKVASPVCGQLNRKIIFPCPCSCLRICSRETCSAVPPRVSLLISILWLNMVLTYGIPPEFRHGVHLFTITAIRHRVSPEFIGSRNIAYRWRSMPRVRRHGASRPQGRLERMLPWPINIRLSFPHPRVLLMMLGTYSTY